MLGFCGPRVSEALALRVSDLDLLRRQANITRTLTELSGGRLEFGEPKTASSRRAVALPGFVSEALAAHLAAFPAGIDGLIFTGTEGGPVRLRNFRDRVWTPAVRRAGLEPLRIHDLRHSAVAIAVKSSAHPKQIQAMCGHSSITVTLDRYGHLFASLADELAKRVDAVGREAATSPGAFSVPSTGPTQIVAWARTGESEL